MHIALIGYGKMGKAIDALATALGHTITHRISTSNSREIHNLAGSDVAIEFTAPDAALPNFESILAQGIPLVTGTTGWYSEMGKVQEMVAKYNGVFLHAANFSIGVHIAMKAATTISQMAFGQAGYRAEIDEWHHTEKKDAPSGTAIRFRESIEASAHDAMNHADTLLTIPVRSHREADIPGTHRIKFISSNDEITLEHKALSRDGFAKGAIAAATFAAKATQGIYTLDDVLKTKP